MTEALWRAVRTDDGRYSIWPAELPVPAGWRPTEVCGDKAECLSWIAENWVDARPAGIGNPPP